MKIYIGADHQGFKLKEQLTKYFSENQIECSDCGNMQLDDSDDFPDFAFKVAEDVRDNIGSFGVLICKSGEGMCIAANKVKNIRAALCNDENHVSLSRQHNDANILVLDSENIFNNAVTLINLFISTAFSGDERHIRRIKKITDYENHLL